MKRRQSEQGRDIGVAVGEANPQMPAKTIDGLVTGLMVGLVDSCTPLVTFPRSPSAEAMRAGSIVPLQSGDVGRQVALLFDGGDPNRPVVVGTVQSQLAPETNRLEPWKINLDAEEVVFTARDRLTLQCGKASITLTKAGKVIIRGEYVTSHSSGVNRIKGGSVQIN